MFIRISLAEQSLTLFDENAQVVRRYPVSTAAKGAGEAFGSYCTPRGKHLIRAKIGAGAPENAVFVARRPTGEIHSAELDAAFPARTAASACVTPTSSICLSGCRCIRGSKFSSSKIWSLL